MAGFDVNRSRIGQNTLAEFLAGPLPTDLIDGPGIGQATVKSLATFDIYNPRQLVGCFLRVCGDGLDGYDRCNAFWFYLKIMGVPGGTRSTIVHAIAEKVNIMIPGTYEPECVANDEAEGVATDLSSTLEANYLAAVMGAYEDGLPTALQVYDSVSLNLIKQLTSDGVLSDFVMVNGGLLFHDDALVVSEAVLLNFCYETGTPVPEFETINIINQE